MRARATTGSAIVLSIGSALSLGACSREHQAFLEFPPAGDAQSMLLASFANGGIAVEAVPRSGSAKSDYHVILSVHDADAFPTQALLYDESLEELDIPAGSVAPAVADAPSAELPQPDRTYSLELDADTGEPKWTAAMRPEPAVTAFKRRREDKCAAFGQPMNSFTVQGRPSQLTRIDADHILAMTYSGNNYLISREEVIELPQRTPTDGVILGASPVGEKIYLGDSSGDIWLADISAEQGYTGLQRVEGLVGGVNSIDGARDNASDLFVHTTVRIVHYDGTNWLEVGDPGDAWGNIVWTGPSEAMMLSDARGVVFRFGLGQREDMLLDSSIELTALGYIPGMGAVAGSGQGKFYRHTEQGWVGLSGADYGFWVLSLAPYEDGFVFLLASGTVGQLRGAEQLCETPALSIIEAGQVAAFDNGDLVVIGQLPGSQTRQGLIIPRRR